MRLQFSDATIGSALKNRPTILGPCFVISDPLAGHYVASISAFILCGSYTRSVFITNDPPALRNIGSKEKPLIFFGGCNCRKANTYVFASIRAAFALPTSLTFCCERVMRQFKSGGHAQRFLSAFGIITSHFRPGRHL